MWDNLITGNHNFQGHKEPITAIAFNPVVETTLASGSIDTNILTWQFGNKTRGYRLFGHSEPVFDLSYSPDGKLIASASQDKTIRLWKPDVHAEVESKEFKAHSSTISSVNFSHDGQKLVTGGFDKVIKVWAVSRQKFLFSLTDHTHWVRCADFSPDDKLIVSCSDDKTIRLFSVGDCSTIGVLCDSKVPVNDVKFHKNGNLLAAGTAEGQVKLYDIRMRKLLHLYKNHSKKVNKLAFHPLKEILGSCSDDGSVQFIDIDSASTIYHLEPAKNVFVNCIAFSNNGEYLASGGTDNILRIYKVSPDLGNNFKSNSTKEAQEVESHPNPRISGGKALLTSNGNSNKSAFLPVQQNRVPTGKKGSLDETTVPETSALLDNIISQVDTLTQTVVILERRLALVEDKMKDVLESNLIPRQVSDSSARE